MSSSKSSKGWIGSKSLETTRSDLPVRNHGRQSAVGGRGPLRSCLLFSVATHSLGVGQGHSRRLGLDRGSMFGALDMILTTHSSLCLERKEEKKQEVILQDSC